MALAALAYSCGCGGHRAGGTEVPAGAGLFGGNYTQLKDAAPHHTAVPGPSSCSRRSCLALQQKLRCLASPVPWDQQRLPPVMDVPRTGEG